MIIKDPIITAMIMVIPLFAFYVLFALRIIERKIALPHDKDMDESYWNQPIINIRDSALITIGLDLAEVARLFPYVRDLMEFKHEMVLVIVLIILHLSALFLSILNKRILSNEDSYAQSISFNKMMHTYISMILLLTNAATINTLVRMI